MGRCGGPGCGPQPVLLLLVLLVHDGCAVQAGAAVKCPAMQLHGFQPPPPPGRVHRTYVCAARSIAGLLHVLGESDPSRGAIKQHISVQVISRQASSWFQRRMQDYSERSGRKSQPCFIPMGKAPWWCCALHTIASDVSHSKRQILSLLACASVDAPDRGPKKGAECHQRIEEAYLRLQIVAARHVAIRYLRRIGHISSSGCAAPLSCV